MKVTIVMTLQVELDEAPLHLAAADPDSLGGVREVVRDLAAEIRHRSLRTAPAARVGDVAAMIVPGDGAHLAVRTIAEATRVG